MTMRVRLAPCLLLVLPFAARAQVSLTGFVQQNTAVNTAAANPDGRHQKWLEERVRLQLDAAAGNWRLLAKADAAYDHLGRGDQSELREGYVDYAADGWDLRLGRQVITWGLGDLVFVNDVWPKDHQALFVGRPLEYLKRGVDAVKLGAYPEFASFEFVAAPTFRESRLPDPRRFHSLLPPVAVEAAGRGDLGLRVYRDLAGWDAALYFYRGHQRTPSMRPAGGLFHPELSTRGASLSGRLGEGVLNLELARYDNSGADAPPAQTRTLVAWQTQPWEDFSLNLQYYGERDVATTHTLGLRATQFFQHQTLRLSLYASRSPSNGDEFVNPEVRYSFSDRVSLAVGANVFGGEPAGQFGQFSGDDNAYLQLRYEF